MFNNSELKSRLRVGERINGCWIEMFNPIATEIIAMSGYDTAFIDLEHGAGSYTDAISMMQALSSGNNYCAPIIRCSSTSSVDIKRVLDVGPCGIMVPNVRNANEAQHVVDACRYGPKGHRGAAPGIIRASRYGNRVEDYLKDMRENFLLIAQIETEEAVDDIERITSIEEIDMIFIGPSDLSASLGVLGDYTSATFRTAFEKVRTTSLKNGKLLGAIPFADYTSEELFKNGHSLIVSGFDSLLLKNAAMQDVKNMNHAKKV